MSLYPGSPRLNGDGQHVLDKPALAQSMAKAIEDAMDDVFLKVKGKPVPETGKEDRRLLYVAISRGVLKYLADHQEAMSAFAIDDVNDTGKIDLDVTMNEHQAH